MIQSPPVAAFIKGFEAKTTLLVAMLADKFRGLLSREIPAHLPPQHAQKQKLILEIVVLLPCTTRGGTPDGIQSPKAEPILGKQRCWRNARASLAYASHSAMRDTQNNEK